MIEPLLFYQLLDKYGKFTLVKLTGGYTNETFLMDGLSPPLVVKAGKTENEDILNEVNSMKLLQQTDVVPKIHDLLNSGPLQLMVMEYREGKNGQSILDQKDWDAAEDLYKSLGETLAKSIHSNKYSFISYGIRECDLPELNLNLHFVPEILIEKSKQQLQEIRDSKNEWVLTHGDYGIHNVLFSTSGALTVIDWEWSEWAHPLNDIAWVFWFTNLHYSKYSPALNRLFLEEYKKHNDIEVTNDKIKSYCVYKVWQVLQRVKDASFGVKQEWIRRLKWTLETDYL